MLSRASYATLLPTIFFSLFAATSVNGHGYVGFISVNGAKYEGPAPVDQAGTLSIKSPIRQITSEEPVVDVTLKSIACGLNPLAPASEVATASAGSTLKVQVSSRAFSSSFILDTQRIYTG